MAVGDIYWLKDFQWYYGQEILNVYFYEMIAVPPVIVGNGSGSLIDRWQALVLPYVRDIQGVSLNHDKLIAGNCFDESDYYEKAVSVYGNYATSAAEDLPTFVATSFRLFAANHAVRSGFKRFAGQTEVTQLDNYIIEPIMIGRLGALRVALARNLTVGVDTPTNDCYKPVLVKRIKYTTPGGKDAYRLPENPGEKVASGISNVGFNLYYTTQVTRKIGG